ncbi:unnamed protein product [Caenorhabditis auriculariae]|uniref:Protein cereblon n=1 Tax=Caenorhabditis auriculariae TaxID=2777116 RepID=A0A8S1HG60_9PELO|nr:unnamed protein product [Caenorhabditis auriculariae]
MSDNADDSTDEEGNNDDVRALVNFLFEGESSPEPSGYEMESQSEAQGPPEDFDISNPSSHGYIFNESNEPVEVTNFEMLAPNCSHFLPVLEIDHVLFPGQSIPLRGNDFIKKILNFPAAVLIYQDSSETPLIGVTARVRRYSSQDGLVQVELVAMQRCRVLQIDKAVFSEPQMARLTILPEYMLDNLSLSVLPNSFRRFSLRKRNRLVTFLTNFPESTLKFEGLEENCNDLLNFFTKVTNKESLQNIVNMSEEVFSFWACTNVPVDIPTKYQLLCESETRGRIASVSEIVRKLTNIKCKQCNAVLSSANNIIKMSSEGVGGHFVNGAGYVHDLLTVSSLENFVRRGFPSFEYSWFRGYSWTILECSECGSHLGWEFNSFNLNAMKFFWALIFAPSVLAQLVCDNTIPPTENWIYVSVHGGKEISSAGIVPPTGPHYCTQVNSGSGTLLAQYQLIQPPYRSKGAEKTLLVEKCSENKGRFLSCTAQCRNSSTQGKLLDAVLSASSTQDLANSAWAIYDNAPNVVVDVVQLDTNAITNFNQPRVDNPDVFCTVKAACGGSSESDPRRDFVVIISRIIT